MSMTEPPVPHEPPVLNRQPHIRAAKSSYGGGLLRKLNASNRSNWYQSICRACQPPRLPPVFENSRLYRLQPIALAAPGRRIARDLRRELRRTAQKPDDL